VPSYTENKTPFGTIKKIKPSFGDDPFANTGQPINISDDDLPF